MRSFRRFATRGHISVLLIAVLLAFNCAAALIPVRALAQTEASQVAVVNFRNTSKMADEMFGTMATDSVVVELLRSGKFSVTKADDLQSKMTELGYKGKEDRILKVALTSNMMQRLGQELGANSIVSGEVTHIKIDKKAKRAEVHVAVRMLDVASREWVNGAIGVGFSHPRIGYTADKETDWIVEAIDDATRKAVDAMVTYIIPVATVLGTFGGSGEILVNKGTQDGLRTGMEMVVLRLGDTGLDEVVGRVRVTSVSDTDAKARVTDSSRGVKPQDRVKAVYELPKDDGGTQNVGSSADKKQSINRGSKIIIGAALLMGLWALMGKGGTKAETVPDAIAVAGASPSVTDRFGDGGVLIAWNPPKPLRTQDILEYHVWRDNVGASIGGGGAGNVGPAWAVSGNTGLSISGVLGSFDHSVLVDQAIWDPLAFSYPSVDHSSLESGSITPIEGLTLGKLHTYYVSCLYQRAKQITGSGSSGGTGGTGGSTSGGDFTFWETTPVLAGRATYLSRPMLTHPGGIAPGEFVDLSDVTFEWQGSRGANLYVIEVSPSPNFDRDITWCSQVIQATNLTGMPIIRNFKDVLSVSPELKGLAESTTLYWRVGARNTQDTPGPYPADPATTDGPKNTRFIYSDPNEMFQFSTLGGLPGLPPGDDGSGNGTDNGENPPGTPL